MRSALRSNTLDHTVDIISAFVGNNHVPVDKLASLIASVHQSLSGLGERADVASPLPNVLEKQKPAVSVKRSVGTDHIISLENGKPYRSLRRHLAQQGMTPDQYRTKWNLPSDYPMVAESYSKRRVEIARSMGLGRSRKA
jgi:predicted transcriptional regulator